MNFWDEEVAGTWRIRFTDKVPSVADGEIKRVEATFLGWTPKETPEIRLVTSDTSTGNAIMPNDAFDDTTIEITGSGFDRNSKVYFNELFVESTFKNDGFLVATIPKALSDSAANTSVPIRVFTDPFRGKGGGESNTYFASIEGPKPVITSIPPLAVEQGDEWKYSMRVSQALLGLGSRVDYRVFMTEPNDLKVINNAGEFIWNTNDAYKKVDGAAFTGDFAVIDLAVYSGDAAATQRCIVKVLPDGSTSMAISALHFEEGK